MLGATVSCHHFQYILCLRHSDDWPSISLTVGRKYSLMSQSNEQLHVGEHHEKINLEKTQEYQDIGWSLGRVALID